MFAACTFLYIVPASGFANADRTLNNFKGGKCLRYALEHEDNERQTINPFERRQVALSANSDTASFFLTIVVTYNFLAGLHATAFQS